MIEYDAEFLPLYVEKRPNSVHVISDATKIDYAALFTANNAPIQMDYLQIDLEVENGSTIATLEKLNKDVLDTYTFATVTFEHDIYRGDFFDTRMRSREIFASRGYVHVFTDIHNRTIDYPYEDWYVHPSLVDMDYVNTLMFENIVNYESNPLTTRSIDWRRINYLGY